MYDNTVYHKYVHGYVSFSQPLWLTRVSNAFIPQLPHAYTCERNVRIFCATCVYHLCLICYYCALTPVDATSTSFALFAPYYLHLICCYRKLLHLWTRCLHFKFASNSLLPSQYHTTTVLMSTPLSITSYCFVIWSLKLRFIRWHIFDYQPIALVAVLQHCKCTLPIISLRPKFSANISDNGELIARPLVYS